MKILCKQDPGGSMPIRSAWGRAFRHCGHDFRFYNDRPILDVISEFEPDVLLGTTYSIDRAHFKAISARPKLKVALFASAWGSLVDSMDRQEFPIHFVSDIEKEWVGKLAQQRDIFAFLHCVPSALEGVLGGWRSLGVRIGSVLNCTDLLTRPLGKFKPEFSCDALFVGGKWGYKSRNLDRFILPLCHPEAGVNLKIFGSSNWGVPQHLGILDDKDYPDAVASSRVCLNVSEPHSTAYGYDVVSRCFDVPAMGGFLVSDRVSGLDEIFGTGVVEQASTPEEFRDKIAHWAPRVKERKDRVGPLREWVRKNHSGFNRAAELFDHLGLNGTQIRECGIAYIRA